MAKTIHNISLREGQQVALIEMGRPIIDKENIRQWTGQDYIRIKNRVCELLNRPEIFIGAGDVLVTSKRKYKLNYDISSYTDQQIKFIIDFSADYIGNLHLTLAAIASPMPGCWWQAKEMSLEQIATDLLNTNFLSAYAAGYHFSKCVERTTLEFKIKRLKEKLDGKPERSELIETKDGMFVFVN